jgi:hypothetical protein
MCSGTCYTDPEMSSSAGRARVTVVVRAAKVQHRDGGRLAIETDVRAGDRDRQATGVGQVCRGPKRWIVERTFGWLGRYRRLSKDYESLPVSSEAVIQIAVINLE